MLSFKGGQTVSPLYDYYVEAGLDDQPVDYSKKYADQDSYEVRRQSKSPKVSMHFASNSQLTHTQIGKHTTCNDEVKIYNDEGTPLTISSASSMCDLRDVGAAVALSSKNETSKKNESDASFSPINNSIAYGTFSDLKQNDLLLANCSSDKRKEDVSCKESKSVTFKHEDDISKASSPLMFSRSSSICSLNSFEQQSLADDRSSVSVFSTSGIISPSDLPDSPMEAASLLQKGVPDRAISPILKSDSDILKDESDNESLNVLEDHISHSVSERDLCPAEEAENFETSALPKKIHSLSSKNEDKSDDDTDIKDEALITKCIMLGIPRCQTPSEAFEFQADLDSYDKKEMELQLMKSNQSFSDKDPELLLKQCVDVEVNSQSAEVLGKNLELNLPLSENESDSDEDDILVNQCIQLGMPKEPSNIVKKPCFPKLQTLDSEVKEISESYPDGISDDDDDDNDLLASCIRAGMPSPKIVNGFHEGKTVMKSKNMSKSINSSNELYETDVKSDSIKNYCSDELPKNLAYSNVQKNGMWNSNSSFKNEQINESKSCPKVLEKPSFSIIHSSSFISRQDMRDGCPDGISDDEEEDDLIASCIQAGMPNSQTLHCQQKRPAVLLNRHVHEKSPCSGELYISEARNDSAKKYCNTRLPLYSSIPNSATWISNSSLIEVDSMRVYQTEDTPILSPSASISDLSSLSFNDDKSCNDSYLNNSRNSDCSSESEDDEILLQCIRSGMPDARRTVAPKCD